MLLSFKGTRRITSDQLNEAFEQAADPRNTDVKNQELAHQIHSSLATGLQNSDSFTVATTPRDAQRLAELQARFNAADPAKPVDTRRSILAF